MISSWLLVDTSAFLPQRDRQRQVLFACPLFIPVQRNKDVAILASLGSTVAPNIAESNCPTCHQILVDTLIPGATGQTVMSIEENINFLQDQKRTFDLLRDNMGNVLPAKERQIEAYRSEISRDRNQIRYLKQTLISDGRLPSRAALKKQVEAEAEIRRLRQALENFDIQIAEFEELSESWRDLQSQEAQLPADDTSQEDTNKINTWTKLFQEQLEKYSFESLEVKDVTISRDNYRPIHEGFDLSTNISASDFIRVIWAYLASLLETTGKFATNHLGLLVFDEPKQQSAKEISFEQLLSTMSQIAADNFQIICATSETQSTLNRLLEKIPHKRVEFDGRIIKKLSTPGYQP